MSATVPVIPRCPNLLYDETALYHYLSACQEQLSEKQASQIISVSQKIPMIDPLAILGAMIRPDQYHFYWENTRNNEAILGYGSIKSLVLNSSQRFIQSHQFIANCLQHLISINQQEIADIYPKIFCGFTFFPTASYKEAVFPAATLFLPQFQVVKKSNQCFFLTNFILNKDVNIKFLVKNVQDILTSIKNVKEQWFTPYNYPFSQSLNIESSYHFKKSVLAALKSIENQRFTKIVLAHNLDVVKKTKFNIIESLNQLRQNHPNCHIFSISNEKGNTFIGASPERLISINNQQLITDALAGSAPRGNSKTADHQLALKLLRSEKERREHQAVIDFITYRLTQLGLTPQRSPLKLLKLANIQHLWTPIYAQLPPQIHPLEIVSHLHPTPAVAGVPTDIVCEEIRRYETFDRSLYASPIGWVDSQGNSEFIVGIRSALITDNHARLYAGAGIVAGSDADKELAEIQLKFQPLLKALW